MKATKSDFSLFSQCLCEVMDLRNDAVRLFYSPQSVYDADVEKYFEGSLVKHLEVSFLSNIFLFLLSLGFNKNYPQQKFERWLESQKTDFLVSNEPTVSDFHLFELLQQNEELAQSLGKVFFFLSFFPLPSFFSTKSCFFFTRQQHSRESFHT